jgi:hypothetical protein
MRCVWAVLRPDDAANAVWDSHKSVHIYHFDLQLVLMNSLFDQSVQFSQGFAPHKVSADHIEVRANKGMARRNRLLKPLARYIDTDY